MDLANPNCLFSLIHKNKWYVQNIKYRLADACVLCWYVLYIGGDSFIIFDNTFWAIDDIHPTSENLGH